ncbi:MAG: hydrolase, partial [Runella zeae]
YSVLKYTFRWAHDWVGKGYDAEVGFVPRKDYFRINPTLGFSFYPRTKLVNRYSVGVALEQYTMPNVGVTDRTAGPFLSMFFNSSARMLFSINQNYTYLFSDFDALRSNGKLPSLKKGEGYTYYNASLNYFSDQRKKWWLFAQPLIGQYYNGTIMSLAGSLNYRYQPYIALAMNFTYNRIDLPIGKNNVFLVGPRLDWTFSKSVFLTTFLQYNSQFENMNINTRFQWRFAPVSDFFLVYIDNYNTTNGQSRNRSIQAKVTYWFNL